MLGEAGARATTELRLPDVRALLGDHLAGRPTRPTSAPGRSRSAPWSRCARCPTGWCACVGVDDGVFPRVGPVDGDDVLARDPVVGERDVRSEDRQLMLDAILAATERLVVTYTGADEHTGQPAPAVPLGELLDALDRTTPEPVRERVVVRHPLQAFDVRNVAPGAAGRPRRPSPSTSDCSRRPGRPPRRVRPAAAFLDEPARRRADPTTSRWSTCSASSPTRSRASSAPST